MENQRRIQNPKLLRFLRHWCKLRGSNPVPSRRDLDPIEIPWALPNIWLMRYEREAGRFRYRLAGEAVQDILDTSLANKTFHDFLRKEHADFLVKKFMRVIEDPAICHDTGPVYVDTDKQGNGERLVLPLANDDHECEYLLGITIYDWDGLIRERTSDGVRYETTYTPVADVDALIS